MTSVKQVVRVQPGHRVEVVSPELVEGDLVDVVVLPRATIAERGGSAATFLDSLPTGPRAFASWEAYEQHLSKEKSSWDR